MDQVRDSVLARAGARPWDRDAIDRRIVEQARDGSGRVINSETDVGGYPDYPATRGMFNSEEWNLETMERRSPALPK